jgi:hypothetical protein
MHGAGTMIECVFTLDYEIYGNGSGALQELVYEPAERLKTIFEKHNMRFVTFVEAAELETIEAGNTDQAIGLVKSQLRDFYGRGYELALHIHPQWYNARYYDGRWQLDYSEYNLCLLTRDRVSQIVARSIDYLRKLLGAPDFTPLSFRAGNWLLQPTRTVAEVLTEQGIKIDSSVYKGGLQHQHNLDYRRSCKNGYYWRFADDVNIPDPQGALLEIPTYTDMVPLWRMFSSKRIGLQHKSLTKTRQKKMRLSRFRDVLRSRYPMKLDFCRLTCNQLTHILDKEIRLDRSDPTVYRPIVAIGHTKDLSDLDNIRAFLSYLDTKKIKISAFQDAYHKAR